LDQTQGTGAMFSETENNVKTIGRDKASESKKDKEIKNFKMLLKAT
jgi:hypothetical protein